MKVKMKKDQKNKKLLTWLDLEPGEVFYFTEDAGKNQLMLRGGWGGEKPSRVWLQEGLVCDFGYEDKEVTIVRGAFVEGEE